MTDDNPSPADHSAVPPTTIIVVGSYGWTNRNAVLEEIQNYWNERGHGELTVYTGPTPRGPERLVAETAETVGFTVRKADDNGLIVAAGQADRALFFIRNNSPGAESLLHAIAQEHPNLELTILRSEDRLPGMHR